MSLRSGEFDRSANQEKARVIKTQAAFAIRELGNHLSAIPNSDGVIVYGLDPQTRLASVLSTPTAHTDDLKAFRSEHIQRSTAYAVDLSVSGLGRQLRHLSKTHMSSAVATSRLGTYRGRHGLVAPQPIMKNDTPVVVAQMAFDRERGELPDTDMLEALWEDHKPHFDALAVSVDDLIQDSPLELHRSLELRSASTPNSGVVRWDLDNSTRLALSSKYGAVRNFLEDWRGTIADHTLDIPNIIINAGDGQNIVIMLSDDFDSADPKRVLAFKASVIDPLVQSLEHAQRELSARYEDLKPHVSISSAFGYIEQNSDGSLDSPALWAAALKSKQK